MAGALLLVEAIGCLMTIRDAHTKR